MVMVIAAVHVPMGQLFLGGVANGQYLHLEGKGFARQGMIHVNGNDFLINPGDGGNSLLFTSLYLELGSQLDLIRILELAPLNRLDQTFFTQPVSFLWCDHSREFIADRFARHFFLKTRDNIPMSLQVIQRLTAIRGI